MVLSLPKIERINCLSLLFYGKNLWDVLFFKNSYYEWKLRLKLTSVSTASQSFSRCLGGAIIFLSLKLLQ